VVDLLGVTEAAILRPKLSDYRSQDSTQGLAASVEIGARQLRKRIGKNGRILGLFAISGLPPDRERRIEHRWKAKEHTERSPTGAGSWE
jgi:hypothetical protein